MIIVQRAVDCIVGLVRDTSILPKGRLISCVLRSSNRQSATVCKGGGLLGYYFVVLEALGIAHTIGIGDCG